MERLKDQWTRKMKYSPTPIAPSKMTSRFYGKFTKLSKFGTQKELAWNRKGTCTGVYSMKTKRAVLLEKMEDFIMYFNAIAKVISDRTGCDISAVKPESTFVELGIDSLDVVELLMNLEDELGFEIELDQAVNTVDDLDKFIQSKQG